MFLSVLQLLRNAPLVVRYTICQQVISIVHLTPSHVHEVASFPGWVNLFLWLLTPFEPNGSGQGRKTAAEVAEPVDQQDRKCASDTVSHEGEGAGEGEGEKEEGDGGEEEGVYLEVGGGDVPGKGEDIHSTVPVVNVGLVKSADCDDVNVELVKGAESDDVNVELMKGAESDDVNVELVKGANHVVTEERVEVRSPTIPQLILREKARPTAHRYRQRLSAFLNHATGRGGSPRRQRAGGRSSGGGESEQRRLVIHNSSWTQADPEDKGEDARQTFTIVTETIGYILWHSVDYEKRQPPWRAWGVFLSSLDEFSGCHPLIMPTFSVKQR